MKILITGITSMHGWPIYLFFKQEFAAHDVYGVYPNKMKKYFTDQDNVFACEMEDKQRLKEIIDQINPSAIIHAGGVCDLDLCEEDPEFAYQVNVVGAKNFVESIGQDTYLMYISSDLVFSGINPPKNGYKEDHDPDPISVVGETYFKAEQEIQKFKNHAIIRIGLPLGPSISGTKGAVDFIDKRLKNNKYMTLFYDEIRSVICSQQLAAGIAKLFKKQVKGVFHYGGKESVSLYDIGEDILTKNNYNKEFLIKSSKDDEVDGPPRIGDVSLNSSKVYEIIPTSP